MLTADRVLHQLRFALGSFVMPARVFLENRGLFRLLIRREVVARTSGTLLGGLWMLVQPALQIFGMWFLMAVVLKVRSPGQVPYLNYFLIGIIAWTMINEILQRSLTVMVEFGPLFQRTVFPLPLLPLLPILVSGVIYGSVLTGVAALLEGWVGAIGALASIIGVLIWLVPIAYLFAVLGLFVRETRQVVPFALTLLLYITPILYMPEQLPAMAREWTALNPLADIMVLLHAAAQGLPWTIGNAIRPISIWLLATPLGWLLFKRTEIHMREAL